MTLRRITHIIRHHYVGEHYPIIQSTTFPTLTNNVVSKPRITYLIPHSNKEAKIIIKYSDYKQIFYKFM